MSFSGQQNLIVYSPGHRQMKTKLFFRQMYLCFPLKMKVIYEKSSSEDLCQEVSIKEVEKEETSAPEFNNEEKVNVVAYLSQVAQRQGHM